MGIYVLGSRGLGVFTSLYVLGSEDSPPDVCAWWVYVLGSRGLHLPTYFVLKEVAADKGSTAHGVHVKEVAAYNRPKPLSPRGPDLGW